MNIKFSATPTPEEMVDALGALLSFAERFKDNTSVTGLRETAEAITLLSTAGFFASIEEAERDDEEATR